MRKLIMVPLALGATILGGCASSSYDPTASVKVAGCSMEPFYPGNPGTFVHASLLVANDSSERREFHVRVIFTDGNRLELEHTSTDVGPIEPGLSGKGDASQWIDNLPSNYLCNVVQVTSKVKK